VTGRVYLDWNATAPLRPEARYAVASALGCAGNPNSVHAEGRAARGIVERARAQVAALVGCEPGEVVFTSGATEAAALALAGAERVTALATEHDCVAKWADRELPVTFAGEAAPVDPAALDGIVCVQAANSETGVIQPELPAASGALRLVDMAQAAGRIPVRFRSDYALLSAHKLGGPKGAGALIVREGLDLAPLLRGGGQELGRRSGTENVAGIAGFGAAAEAARREVEDGAWGRVEKIREILEESLFDAAPDLILLGEGAARLPNTTCVALPGWKGETQVMQMDLAGFAVSAGSACSSGKVGPSRALRAMGFDEATAGSAIRVSIGPATKEAEVRAFAVAWGEKFRRFRAKSA
jgi:cysteine desulfurase